MTEFTSSRNIVSTTTESEDIIWTFVPLPSALKFSFSLTMRMTWSSESRSMNSRGRFHVASQLRSRVTRDHDRVVESRVICAFIPVGGVRE